MSVIVFADLKTKRGRERAGFQSREMKSRGMSNRRIAFELNISPTTVARLLTEPAGDEELLVIRMKEIVRAYRTRLLEEITSLEEYKIIFGDDLGDTYKLGIHNNKHEIYLRAGKSGYEIMIESSFTATKEDLTEADKEMNNAARTEV